MEELIERMKKDMEYRRKKAEQEGLEQGLEQGLAQGLIKTAKKMLMRNMSLEDISDITGLSMQEIQKLKTV